MTVPERAGRREAVTKAGHTSTHPVQWPCFASPLEARLGQQHMTWFVDVPMCIFVHGELKGADCGAGTIKSCDFGLSPAGRWDGVG